MKQSPAGMNRDPMNPITHQLRVIKWGIGSAKVTIDAHDIAQATDVDLDNTSQVPEFLGGTLLRRIKTQHENQPHAQIQNMKLNIK